jgi:hypothetical protein
MTPATSGAAQPRSISCTMRRRSDIDTNREATLNALKIGRGPPRPGLGVCPAIGV